MSVEVNGLVVTVSRSTAQNPSVILTMTLTKSADKCMFQKWQSNFFILIIAQLRVLRNKTGDSGLNHMPTFSSCLICGPSLVLRP